MFNGVLSQNLGNYPASAIIHFLGLIIISLVLTVKRIRINLCRDIPLYLYIGGFLGVFTILFNNIGFSHLGASLTLALGLLGQTIASIVIDHFGLLGMEIVKFRKEKLAGLIAISLGIVIMTVY
jgi:transporter family-2 protein